MKTKQLLTENEVSRFKKLAGIINEEFESENETKKHYEDYLQEMESLNKLLCNTLRKKGIPAKLIPITQSLDVSEQEPGITTIVKKDDKIIDIGYDVSGYVISISRGSARLSPMDKKLLDMNNDINMPLETVVNLVYQWYNS